MRALAACTFYGSELDFGWCRRPDAVLRFFVVSFDDDDEEVDGSLELWRSWYSWKQGTIHKFVWHSGQWYLVFRRKIRPCASIVFQQKLQPNAGPGRITGQCWERFSNEISRIKCCECVKVKEWDNKIDYRRISRHLNWFQSEHVCNKPAVMIPNVVALPWLASAVTMMMMTTMVVAVVVLRLTDRLVRQLQQMSDSDREQWASIQSLMCRCRLMGVRRSCGSHYSIQILDLFRLRRPPLPLLPQLLRSQMDHHDLGGAVSGLMAGTIADAMKDANAARADDKRIAYHILIDWVHCAVWLKHVAQLGDASSPMWSPTAWVAIVMTILVLVPRHVVQSFYASMVWQRQRTIVANMGSCCPPVCPLQSQCHHVMATFDWGQRLFLCAIDVSAGDHVSLQVQLSLWLQWKNDTLNAKINGINCFDYHSHVCLFVFLSQFLFLPFY